jgi:SNF2 family DNA or RNA helicase
MFEALLNNKRVGFMTVGGNNGAYQIGATQLSPKLQGMGLGRKMYMDVARQLPQNSVLRSDNIVSPAAQNVWDSMQRRGYNVMQDVGPFHTPTYAMKLPSAIPTMKTADLLPEVQLQEHQQRIADEVTEDSPRMLVYHGLGSGKSLSALAAAEAAKKRFGGNYGIVAPASLKGNFEKEIKKFTTGSDPEVMSYTGLGLGKQFKEQPETLIMDEAHRLRNPNAASSQAAAQAAANAKRLLLLTGSPVTNEPSDMANLLSLIHNKNITPEEFNKQYVGQKTVWPGLMGWLKGVQPGVKPVVKNEAELRKLLAGHVDYQPSKTPDGVNVNEQTVNVPLSAEQQKIQKAIRTQIPPGFLWKLDNEFPLSREELSKLNSFMSGMRQVSLSTQPFRVDKDPGKAFTQSAKLQTAFNNLQKELQTDPRKKAIIYSNFVDSGLAPYASALDKAKVPHGFFHGGVSPKARQAAVDAYNAGKLRALLIGPAGAEGLSTKGTSLIQLLDPHWHESRSQQARGRGLRFDSHVGLPEELKNVAVQRYLSSSEDPSMLGKLMGYKRERTGDEVLAHLANEKERVNEEFRRILREEGSKNHAPEKLAAVFNSMPLQSARLKARLKKLKLRASNVKLVAQTPAANQPPDSPDSPDSVDKE